MASYDQERGGSPPPRDQISELESQLRELQVALAEERKRRQEERDSAATRERLLQAQLKDKASSPRKSPLVPRVAGLRRATPPPTPRGERNLGATSPRTSDALFVATPSDTTGSRPTTPRGRVTPRGRTGEGANGTARGASSPRAASPAVAAKQPETALQHAWNKFCVRARGEFTPQELALVSSETLESLLVHYGTTNAVEKAQVEAQWALLQEGLQATTNPTLRKPGAKRRGPLNFPNHPAPFEVDVSLGGPHLSRRTPLRDEAARGSNPNDTTSASGFVRTTSGTRPLTPRRAGVSDPNDTQGVSSPWRSCVGPTDGPRVRPSPHRGMMHVSGPTSGEYTPRGIRSEGSTRMGSDSAKAEGLRVHLESHKDTEGNRRGIRTYVQESSPTFVQRPSKIVSTPPHIERSRLATETLVNSPHSRRQAPQAVEPLQRRTPFALDLGAVQSANARSQR
jgi:hypothetical protein